MSAQPLMYRKPGAGVKLSRPAWIAVFVVAAGFAMFMIGSFIPTSRRTDQFMCSVCGKEKTHVQCDVVGFVYRDRTIESTDTCGDIYERLIGLPHQHQWAPDGHSIGCGNLWGYGGVGCGGSGERAEAVYDALKAIESDFRNRPIEERRALYAMMQQMTTSSEIQAFVRDQKAVVR